MVMETNDCDGDFLDQFKNRPMTVVAVGKTGKGKSSTLNSILKLVQDDNPFAEIEYFKSGEGPESVSSAVKCVEVEPIPRLVHRPGTVGALPVLHPCKDSADAEEQSVRLSRRPGLVSSTPFSCPPIRLVDTIGLFDTKMTAEEQKKCFDIDKMSCVDKEHELVLKQFLEVMEICKEGIDAFLFVLKAIDRASPEEIETIDIIFRYLGWNMLDYVIFVITMKGDAEESSYKGWRDRICGILQERGYPRERIEDRFIFVNNKNPTKEQAEDLLSLVQYVNRLNGGNPYTNAAFKAAQDALEKEKEQIKQKLKAEFQGKVDVIVKPIEEHHQKEISKLGSQIDNALKEISKLTAAQEAQRQQFQANIIYLQAKQEDEKRCIEAEKDRQRAEMEVAHRYRYEQERNAMTASIQQLQAQMKQQNQHMQQQLDEARNQRRRRRRCSIM